MDQTLLGETAAKLMDHIEESDLSDGELIAVGIVAIISKGEGDEAMTYTRTMSNENIHYRALGLFYEGFQTLKDGHMPDEIEDDS